MNKILENIQGDKTLWAVLLLLAGFSFLPVYSAASNLAYVSGGGNTFGFLFKHFISASGDRFLYRLYSLEKTFQYFAHIQIDLKRIRHTLENLQPPIMQTDRALNIWL